MPKKRARYKRIWLNPPSAQEDSYVATTVNSRDYAISLADCGRRVTIHGYYDKKSEVNRHITKVKKLRDAINEVLVELERIRDGF